MAHSLNPAVAEMTDEEFKRRTLDVMPNVVLADWCVSSAPTAPATATPRKSASNGLATKP
jgi:hypothetical protein